MTRPIRLTRQQWMALPLEYKTRIGASPAVRVDGGDGRVWEIPVHWATDPVDSDHAALDLDAHRQ